MSRLLIMAAGTGGHIFPGLAIADTMRARGWQVSWLGTTRGMEADIVPRHGVDFDAIDFSGLRGKGLLHTITGALKLVLSFFSCLSILLRRKPDVVLGMGGYVTVPGGVMAKVCGVPLALVNADAALLMSNKALLPFAKKVLFGFAAQGDELECQGTGHRQPGETRDPRIAGAGATLCGAHRPAEHSGHRRQSGRKSIERHRAGRTGADR